MASFEEQVKGLNFRGLMISSVLTALAFVVGLFWRDAISDTVDIFVPTAGEGLFYKYLAAIVATVVVFVIAYILIKLQEIKIQKAVEKARAIAEARAMQMRKRK